MKARLPQQKAGVPSIPRKNQIIESDCIIGGRGVLVRRLEEFSLEIRTDLSRYFRCPVMLFLVFKVV